MNHLLLWKDFRLFYGSHPRPIKTHSHPVVQFVIAAQSSFLSRDSSGDWVPKKGLLIAPNHAHECDANNVPIISLDIDPESSLGEWILNNQLKSHSIVDYPSTEMTPIDIDRFLDHLKSEGWQAIRTMVETTFGFQNSHVSSKKDGRIQDVLEFISKYIDQHITSEVLAEVAFLSESRLLHLFKEVMGLPIRNYILWHRLQIALELVMDGNSLTAASHGAGFSDQAHMTRTFTKMMGVPPSLIAKNSKFVQVSILK